MTDDKILCCRECSDVVELERVEQTLVCPECAKVYPTDIAERCTGRTTRQMLAAPREAVFVSCHPAAVSHDRELARKHGREDLRIVEPSWLDHGWYGKILTGIVVDHAANLSERQRDALMGAQTRIR